MPASAAASERGLAVELRGITKRFGAFTANDGIDLAVRQGEIHAIVGKTVPARRR